MTFQFLISYSESLTYRDIVEVLPFGNQADIIELKGVYLLEALELSVSAYNPKAPNGQFLQVSGWLFFMFESREFKDRLAYDFFLSP